MRWWERKERKGKGEGQEDRGTVQVDGGSRECVSCNKAGDRDECHGIARSGDSVPSGGRCEQKRDR